MQRWGGFHSGVPRTILQEASILCLGSLTVPQQPQFTGSGPRGCVFMALSGPLPNGGQCAHPELVCELELSYMGCKSLQRLPYPASHKPELSKSVQDKSCVCHSLTLSVSPGAKPASERPAVR